MRNSCILQLHADGVWHDLQPDGIARRIRWEDNNNGQPDWGRVLDRVCELAAQVQLQERRPGPSPLQRHALAAGLRAMVPRLRAIAATGAAMGLEPAVHAHLRPGIEARANELESMT